MSDNHSRQRPDETDHIEQQLLEQQRISRELLDDLHHAAPLANSSFRQALEDRLLSHWQTNSHEREDDMNGILETQGMAHHAPTDTDDLIRVGARHASSAKNNSSPPYILTLAAAMIALVLIGFIILGMNRSSMQVAQAATDTPSACVPPDHWLREYIVQEGDTLFSIATSLGLEVNVLLEGNCLTSPELTYVGQVIYLPPSAPVTPFDACIFSAAVNDSIASRPEIGARFVAQIYPSQVMQIIEQVGDADRVEWYRVRVEIEESFIEGWIHAHDDLHGTICDVQVTPEMPSLCNVATSPSQTFLRTRPLVNSNTVTILPAGHELAVYQIVGNPAGLQWFNARTVKDGEVLQGWVRQDSLTADSEACPSAPNSVVASVPTATPEGFNATCQMLTIGGDGAGLRANPSLGASTLAMLGASQQGIVLEWQDTEDERTWYRVRVAIEGNLAEGWIREDQVTHLTMTTNCTLGISPDAIQAVILPPGSLETPSDPMLLTATQIIAEATQRALDLTATAVSQPSGAPMELDPLLQTATFVIGDATRQALDLTATQFPTFTPPPTISPELHALCTIQAREASVSVRAQPEVNGERVALLPLETPVDVIAQQQDAQGNVWYNVRYSANNETITGWVRANTVDVAGAVCPRMPGARLQTESIQIEIPMELVLLPNFDVTEQVHILVNSLIDPESASTVPGEWENSVSYSEGGLAQFTFVTFFVPTLNNPLEPGQNHTLIVHVDETKAEILQWIVDNRLPMTIFNAPHSLLAPAASPAITSQIEMTVEGAGDLENERVIIRNNGDTIDLSGLAIHTLRGLVYTFPEDRRLFSGAQIELYTRAGTDTPIVFYAGLDEAAFVPTERLILTDADGNVLADAMAGE